MFYISSGIYLVGCIIYWLWASGEVQPWARQEIIELDTEKNEQIPNSTLQGHVNEGADIKA